MVLGLHPDLAEALLRDVVVRLRGCSPEERRTAFASRLDGVMQPPFAPGFRSLGPYVDDGTFALGVSILGTTAFSVMQMLVPDRHNRLPGEPGCAAAFVAQQAWPVARQP